MQKSIEYYRLTTIKPDIVTIDDGHAFITYITAFAEPKTQTETLWLSYSKQWEKAINTEYNNPVHNSIIEWVDKPSENKCVITRKVVYKENENENRDFLKCHTHIVTRGFLQIPGKNFTEAFA